MEKIRGTLLLCLTFIKASTIYGSDIDHDLDTKLELQTMTNVLTIDMMLELEVD